MSLLPGFTIAKFTSIFFYYFLLFNADRQAGRQAGNKQQKRKLPITNEGTWVNDCVNIFFFFCPIWNPFARKHLPMFIHIFTGQWPLRYYCVVVDVCVCVCSGKCSNQSVNKRKNYKWILQVKQKQKKW